MSSANDASQKLREAEVRIFLPVRLMISAVTLVWKAQRSLTESLGLPVSRMNPACTQTRAFVILRNFVQLHERGLKNSLLFCGSFWNGGIADIIYFNWQNIPCWFLILVQISYYQFLFNALIFSPLSLYISKQQSKGICWSSQRKFHRSRFLWWVKMLG